MREVKEIGFADKPFRRMQNSCHANALSVQQYGNVDIFDRKLERVGDRPCGSLLVR
jgi:hypothetical protein